MGAIAFLFSTICQLSLQFVTVIAKTFPTLTKYLQIILLAIHEKLSEMDPEYLQWLYYLAIPLVIMFVLPLVFILIVYGSALWLHMYQFKAQIKRAYATSVWDGARTALAAFYDGVGWLWYGYEVEGLDNIPQEGPALIVFYHGPLPTDMYFLMAKLILFRKRMLASVGDRFLQRIPGMKLLCDVFHITPGTVESCVDTLKKGELLCVSPGGVREALFSDPNFYDMIWKERLGFAKVAIKAKVPIVPMFTENCRESFRVPSIIRRFLRIFYERFRLPLVIYLGGLPVKMRTHLGPAITFTEEEYDQVTPQEVRDKAHAAITALIDQHQRLPGNMLFALIDRFYTCPRCDKNKQIHEGIVTRRRPPTPTNIAEIEIDDENEDIEGSYIPPNIMHRFSRDVSNSRQDRLQRSATLPTTEPESDQPVRPMVRSALSQDADDHTTETTSFISPRTQSEEISV